MYRLLNPFLLTDSAQRLRRHQSHCPLIKKQRLRACRLYNLPYLHRLTLPHHVWCHLVGPYEGKTMKMPMSVSHGGVFFHSGYTTFRSVLLLLHLRPSPTIWELLLLTLVNIFFLQIRRAGFCCVNIQLKNCCMGWKFHQNHKIAKRLQQVRHIKRWMRKLFS